MHHSVIQDLIYQRSFCNYHKTHFEQGFFYGLKMHTVVKYIGSNLSKLILHKLYVDLIKSTKFFDIGGNLLSYYLLMHPVKFYNMIMYPSFVCWNIELHVKLVKKKREKFLFMVEIKSVEMKFWYLYK